ncbi:putative PEP-binding protein [Sanguibacter massiliensis]|uniref:putative PEP-binding protein n=1 Tax=Sanguibacter massiliensis TaxID=1973217 RepID=UPI000C861765|nr:putative PEP-binding protein [Sanguibacter massiliensis]
MTAGGRTLAGVGVGRGAVVGPVALVRAPAELPDDAPAVRDGAPAAADDVEQVVVDAFAAVAADLRARADRASGPLAEVLGATVLIASDPSLLAGARAELGAGAAPVAAVRAAVGRFIDMFTSMGGLMAERVTDLVSVRDRVVARVAGAPLPGVPDLAVPSVVVARDLAPADTAALDLGKVLAIVTELGGPTGHTAIIAGQLGLPCLVQVAGATALEDGTSVVVDARAGELRVDPSDDDVAEVADRARREAAFADDAAPGATSDGHPVDLLANIGTAADAERAAAADDARTVAGSGLFRTEVLFLDATTAPSVAQQTREYTAALTAFGDRKVVVRTLDAGADKPLAFATLPDEENPALGVRGYRIDRVHPQLLADQLEALAVAAAATGTRPWVMAPMVATPAEARALATAARAAGLEQVGVMVEVPAAALRAREILAEVDFVSIGTNDLAQYTMATDRLRGELADLLDPWQPAVLDLVAATARAGAEAGKPVGVCGESAGDPVMALALVGLGVTSLSMSLGSVPAVRFALRRHTRSRCVEIAQAALAASSAADARAAAVALLDEEVAALLA